MKRFLILALVLICSPAFATLNNPLSDTYPELGEGCTNARYIDKDCDGYGVGYEYVTGPDADDTDATVNDTDSVVDKYGDVETFVDSKYTCDRYAFVQSGGTRTGDPSSSWSTAIADPYSKYTDFNTLIDPGDCIIFRSGTWTGTDRIYHYGAAVSGTVAKPIVIMAYPGELPIFTTSSNFFVLANQTETVYSHDFIFDGFLIYNTTASQIQANNAHGLTFRNNEWNTTGSAAYSFGSLEDWTFEYNVFDKQGLTASDHAIYVGNRCCGPTATDCTWQTSDNFILRGNVFHEGHLPCTGNHTIAQRDFQFNGYVTNLLIEDNIFDGTRGYSHVQLLNGTIGIIQNNVFLGASYGSLRVGFSYTYPENCGSGCY
jgi:hypothetical protein